jgi:hypothetical protein
VGILLSLVLEVEEKEGYMSRARIPYGFDILDDRRAVGWSLISVRMNSGWKTSLSTLFPEPAMDVELCEQKA